MLWVVAWGHGGSCGGLSVFAGCASGFAGLLGGGGGSCRGFEWV